MAASRSISVGLHMGTSPGLRRIHALARAGRILGVHSLWTVDHYTGWFPQEIWDRDFTWLASGDGGADAYFDWQVLLGHMAGRTGRARVGVGVTEAIRRHPVTIAQAALTLSHMTKRPPIIGLGAGEAENVLPYGMSFAKPVSRLSEALEVIRLCLDSKGPVGYQGEFFRLDRAIMDLQPGPGGKPEIWLAAHGPRMLELTGRFADGWLPTLPMTPEGYAGALAAIRTAAILYGRDPDEIVPSYQVFLVVAPSHAAAKRYLQHRAVKFMALLTPDRFWQEAGVTHPLGRGFRGLIDFIPSHYSRAEIDAAIDTVPVEFMATQTVWGTPKEVVHKIRAYGDAGMRNVVLAPISALVSRRSAAFALASLPRIIRRLKAGS